MVKKTADRNSIAVRWRQACALLAETLREIFDETAYRRFLTRRGLASSKEAYAEFLHEGQTLRERRPRCC